MKALILAFFQRRNYAFSVDIGNDQRSAIGAACL
jgi:hypothetical protein